MRVFLVSATILLVSVFAVNAASVDVHLLTSVPLGSAAKQVVTTADGQRIYVLTQKNEIQLYSADGRLEGTFPVGEEVTGIAPQGANRLILLSAERQEMVLVALTPVVQISTEGAPIRGPVDAPVTITVFDDFECPYCARAVPLLKEVLQAYPEQVRLVFKNFPLPMHKHARLAAAAGMAAQRQGKFWPLHDLLYANYNQLDPQKIRELAGQVGLDLSQFDSDLKDPELQSRINADLQEGQQIGVRGTPTIFVDGRRLLQRSRAGFDQLIQQELSKLEQNKSGQTAQ